MDQIKQNASHLVTALVVIAAACVLAGQHIIDGSTAVALIASAGGASLGGGLASSSITGITLRPWRH